MRCKKPSGWMIPALVAPIVTAAPGAACAKTGAMLLGDADVLALAADRRSSSPATAATEPDEAETGPAGHADSPPVTGMSVACFALAAVVPIIGGLGALLPAGRRRAA